MRIDHYSLYTMDLEGMKNFYEGYFQAVSGSMYHNPKTGLRTFFLAFPDGGRLEIMSVPGLTAGKEEGPVCGYAHLAIGMGGRDAVDALTERLRLDGIRVKSGPRTTGDGYYESCVFDPDGNQIELVADD
jgi:lactoylglutathione lyase